MRASNQDGSENGKDKNDARTDRHKIRHLPLGMPVQIGRRAPFCDAGNWSLIWLVSPFNYMANYMA
jgi:hypothetical protein